MGDENVILTGFMGSGKTAVGKALAEHLNYRFFDTDQIIETRAGKSISEIFTDEGEASFRAREAQVARELAVERRAVIATGGRLMLDLENERILGQSGRVFCLTASPEEIIKRLRAETGQRPLLDGPDPASRIVELLAMRAEGYSRFRQISTDNKGIEAIAREIELIMDERIIPLTHPSGRYDVLIGAEMLPSYRDRLHIKGRVAVITDSHVGPLYAEDLPADVIITMPAGEAHKTLATVNGLYSQLLAAGMDRLGTIVALGGGVVGDVAGFAAATYMRGIEFVQAPTSLLAMVDASVGGKTGVDLPEGKNLVGAFKQPLAVLVDLATLVTLPDEEFSCGMAEVIKSGIIADPQLFQLVESESARLKSSTSADLELLRSIIGDSIEVKRQIVEEDPYEQGKRAYLNLGHTFGHAIEQVSGYRVRHGEGVAIGLVAAANLSARLGSCSPHLEPRIARVVNGVNLPVRIPDDLQAELIYEAMFSDKKKASGKLRFVLPREVGDVFVTDQVPFAQVMATLRHCGAG